MAKAVGELERCYAVYRGTVVNNKDPLNKRRLKVVIPSVLGDTPTQWAWPLENAGMKSEPPAVGQGVWVMFENGDPSYPIWAGVFGKVIDNKKHVLIKPQSGTGEYLIESTFSDGRKELDLVATLLHMSETLEDFEQRIADLEADMPIALQNGL